MTSSPPTNPAAEPGHASRVPFLDALRGIAVGAVLISHIAQHSWPAYEHFHLNYFDLGTAGVVVFFLCSGFIIPVSLERAKSVPIFWVRRFFRLYPLYWLSIVLMALIFALLRPSDAPPEFYAEPAKVIGVQLTMFQMALGVPHMLGLYWTLFYEMIFYIVVTVLAMLKVVRWPEVIVVGVMAGTLLVEVIAPVWWGRGVALSLVGFLIIMFNGTLFYKVHTGTLSAARACVLVGLSVAVLLATIWANGEPLGQPFRMYLATAWVGGYIIFLIGFFLRHLHVPRALIFLGHISYSVYLMHDILRYVLPSFGHPALRAAIWFVLAIAISTLTYRLVEQPAIAMGNRIAARLKARKLEDVPQEVRG